MTSSWWLHRLMLVAGLFLLAPGCGEGMLDEEEDAFREEGDDEGALSPPLDGDWREPASCSVSFGRPVPGGITSPFGYRCLKLTGCRMHYGVDLAAGVGTSVRAAMAGKVVYRGYDAGGYGYWMEVAHCGGWRTRYAHLSKFSVGNISVAKGRIIGKSGRSGAVTGPHLHFETRHNGTAINPCKNAPWC